MDPSSTDSPVSFPDRLFPIDETLPDDVFIAGYPKSGNTLLQHIIAHLVYGLNENVGRTLVQLLVPDVHANTHYFRHRDRCFLKTHEPPKAQHRNVIYVMRDGREAMLSYYHMLKNMGQDISHESVFSGKLQIQGGQWHEHVAAWESNPFGANILWIRYEELKSDKLTQLKRICEFLDLKRSDQQIQEVVRLTSLDHMKAVEQRSDWRRANEGVFTKPACFVRQGKTDSFRKEVDPQILSRFEARSEDVLQRYYPDAA
ncbi:Sulfotransferase domain protein [Stieleria neptunia]|uniref:Sulfotransferase domain protein n=2 Tax=Stieleria neptunia TaxID=2527979 RepID=A0A518HYE7_9BACT|nr:Sulfotransferase domain protein [Stieleria neptunia]